jgi:hypothetical protein
MWIKNKHIVLLIWIKRHTGGVINAKPTRNTVTSSIGHNTLMTKTLTQKNG